jgi:predicted regulator of Ras-like GTPase activity (Roadblock/LC7/MglB family)
MRTLCISAEQSRILQEAAKDLAIEAAAETVVLLDRTGTVLADVSIRGKRDFANVAALGAGVFVATRELASMVGEKAFTSVYHQGVQTSVFMRDVCQAFIVMVVFDKKTTVGLVKLFTDKMVDRHGALFRAIAAQDVPAGAGTVFELDPAAEPFAMLANN